MHKIFYLHLLFLLISCSSSEEKKAETQVSQDTITAPSQTDNIAKTRADTAESRSVLPVKTATKLKAQVDKDYLLGKFDFRQHPDFVKVEAEYTSKYGEAYLRKEAYLSFKEMAESAQKEANVKLIIISAARNFYKQKEIWENKWTGKYSNVPEGAKRAEEILKFSSMPSTSRHHWGTDMDLNSLENGYFLQGEGKKIYEWLLKNAEKYGFCNVYSAKDASRPNGYNEEKWHWSYLPLAKPFLAQYKATITLADITGFEGSDTKTELSVIKNYVEGINTTCQ